MTSLYRKIALAGILLIFFALAISTFLSIRTTHNILHKEMEKRAVTLMRSLQEKCRYAITMIDAATFEHYIDRRSLQDFVEEVRQNESDVRKVLVIERSGKVLSSLDPRFSELILPEYALAEKSAYEPGPRLQYGPLEHDLIITAEIRVADTMWGTAVLQFSKDSMHRDLDQITLQASGTGLVLLIIGALITLPLVGRIARPIKELSRHAEALGNGKLNTRIEISSSDEVGQLAATFNSMASKLHLTLRNLEERLIDLRASEESLRRSEKNYRDIFENAIEGIFQVSNRGEFLSVNPALAEILGYTTPDELTDSIRDIGDQLYFDGRERQRFLQELRCNNRVVGFETLWRRKDGRQIWVSISARTILDSNGRILHHEGNIVDISEVKENERAHRQREKAERARAVAEAANEAKGQFLANMSHEIRTPMNAILGFLELSLRTELTPKQTEFLEAARSASNSLLGIINTILDFSKAEAGKIGLEKTEFELEALLKRTALLCILEAEAKGVEFLIDLAADCPTRLVGDPLRLGQVLTNLCSNAIKFTDAGEVVVRVESLPTTTSGVKLAFSVSDTGIGLHSKQINGLFQSFTQADSSTTRKYGGTGLGLAISKHLVTLMGGEVVVQSELTVGSTFSFTCLLQKGDVEIKSTENPPASLPDCKVLVVDGNATAREIYRKQCRQMGAEAETAANAAEASQKLVDTSVDLILINQTLSRKQFLEMAKAAKGNGSNEPVPLLVVLAGPDRTNWPGISMAVEIDMVAPKPLTPCGMRSMMLASCGVNAEKLDDICTSDWPAGGLEGVRILVVDDNEVNLRLATEFLTSAGGNVTAAGGGRAAVGAICVPDGKLNGTHGFDLVLMDVQMPDMDGYEATRIIRRQHPDLPIIAMTAHTMADDKTRCHEAGMNDHIGKPFRPQRFIEIVSKWCQPKDWKLQKDRALQNPKTGQRAATVVKPDLPSIEGLALNRALGDLSGNRQLLDELLATFQRVNADTAHQIRNARERGDRAEIQRIAHTVKSTAAVIGAEELARLSRQLERKSYKMVSTTAEEMLEKFDRQLQNVQSAITSYFAAVSCNGQQGGGEEKIPALEKGALVEIINGIVQLLETDISGAFAKVRQLESGVTASFMKEEIRQLRTHMSDFEFTAATGVLQAIKQALETEHRPGEY